MPRENRYVSLGSRLQCSRLSFQRGHVPRVFSTTQVGQHLTYGVLNKEDFKVVYVAPMKALAAEMTSAFGRRLRTLGIAVRELTGDMQLSKRELEETQIVVTTPEKWDVLTRKGSEVSMAAAVRLLIIDEVHLLNDDRGPVIETLVARTLRQVSTLSNPSVIGPMICGFNPFQNETPSRWHRPSLCVLSVPNTPEKYPPRC
jgi:activating signal cointegrator complex subunit 3